MNRRLRTARPGLLFFLLLTGLFLAALSSTACAARQEADLRAQPQSAGVGKSKVKPSTQRQPKQPGASQPRTTDSAETRPQAAVSGTAGTGPAGAGTIGGGVVVQRMLTGAGRDATTVQPESGFTLRVPDQVWAGEPFSIVFGASGLQKLEVNWNGKRLALTPEPSGNPCQALLAVSLTEKSASLPLVINVFWKDGKAETFTADLPVKKRDYPVQRLKVEKKYVTPPPEVQERIKREQAELRAVITRISPIRYWSLPMLRPVPGEVTSLYGLRRVFNGQERNPHKGVDFDANTGDPVAALDQGVVVLVAEHYYSGNIVVVDHGLGVYSLYLHLSAFNVSVGQRIARGETVGLIGSTGRVTGPHLHLSFAVLGDLVNGATCIDM